MTKTGNGYLSSYPVLRLDHWKMVFFEVLAVELRKEEKSFHDSDHVSLGKL